MRVKHSDEHLALIPRTQTQLAVILISGGIAVYKAVADFTFQAARQTDRQQGRKNNIIIC